MRACGHALCVQVIGLPGCAHPLHWSERETEIKRETERQRERKTERKMMAAGNTKGGKYHCTIDLLFDRFGLVCFANKNK